MTADEVTRDVGNVFGETAAEVLGNGTYALNTAENTKLFPIER